MNLNNKLKRLQYFLVVIFVLAGYSKFNKMATKECIFRISIKSSNRRKFKKQMVKICSIFLERSSKYI